VSRTGDIIAALVENLRSIEDVQVLDRAVSVPTPPTIQILPAPTRYHLAMGAGLTELALTIQAFAPFEPQWLDMLCEWIDTEGSTSIVAAAEQDQTLGGLASDVTVTDHSGVSLANVGGQDVLLIEFRCVVEVEGA
jgi:hypothetical protein